MYSEIFPTLTFKNNYVNNKIHYYYSDSNDNINKKCIPKFINTYI